ncbi:hypothetical protein TSAR_007573 [Trichomalopsis sarcophagae]|uniref:Uncharacterized protein n=1 Tax=Trichomalopsis sarcophagae TaxID=543379 RepID=A0A232ESF3_9HYME|nr:hypothetical protein TSAR_007573 [Trichomalopsis sarcophagae]
MEGINDSIKAAFEKVNGYRTIVHLFNVMWQLMSWTSNGINDDFILRKSLPAELTAAMKQLNESAAASPGSQQQQRVPSIGVMQQMFKSITSLSEMHHQQQLPQEQNSQQQAAVAAEVASAAKATTAARAKAKARTPAVATKAATEAKAAVAAKAAAEAATAAKPATTAAATAPARKKPKG